MDFEKDFREWYFKNHCKSNIKYEDLMPHHIEDIFGWFDNLPLSFRWGVMVDFFDEKGIELAISRYTDVYQIHVFNQRSTSSLIDGYYKSLDEARKAAYEKAKEIYERLNQ